MPLVKCPDCERQISDAAPTCPNCERPMVLPLTREQVRELVRDWFVSYRLQLRVGGEKTGERHMETIGRVATALGEPRGAALWALWNEEWEAYSLAPPPTDEGKSGETNVDAPTGQIQALARRHHSEVSLMGGNLARRTGRQEQSVESLAGSLGVPPDEAWRIYNAEFAALTANIGPPTAHQVAMQKVRRSNAFMVGGIAVAVSLMFGFWWMSSASKPQEPTADIQRREKSRERERTEPAYIDLQKRLVRARLKDPASAQFRNVKVYYARAPVVCGEVNSRNAFGGYTGFQAFISGGSEPVGSIQILYEDMKGAEMATLIGQWCR